MECARKREKCRDLSERTKKRQRYRFRSKSEISLSTYYKLYILAQNDANKKHMQSKKALGFKIKKKGFKFGLVRGRNPVQIWTGLRPRKMWTRGPRVLSLGFLTFCCLFLLKP
jgi:hypothetical protein